MQNQSLKTYSYKDFQDNFLKIFKEKQSLKKNGIVFIGNSRIGKSTLACLLSGIKMKIVIDQYNIGHIQPEDQQFKKAVKHSKMSVTEIPNIYRSKFDGQEYSVIDLPGFRDSSYFKQICNLHYIKTIIDALEKMCFLMVIEVHPGQKKLQQKELLMMERFYQTFPQAASNTIVIVNMTDSNIDQKQKKNTLNIIKEQINSNLCTFSTVKKNFFSEIFKSQSNVLFVKKLSTQQQNQQLNRLNQDLQRFIRNNKISFRPMKQIRYQIDLDVEPTQTKTIKDLLINIALESINRVDEGIKVINSIFQQIVNQYEMTSNNKISSVNSNDQLQKFIAKYDAKRQIEVLKKIKRQMLSQVFCGERAKSVDNVIFQITNTLIQYSQNQKDKLILKIFQKLTSVLNLLSMIIPDCTENFQIFLLFISIKLEEIQFLESSIKAFLIDPDDQQATFQKHIYILKFESIPKFRNILQISTKLNKIADKCLQKLSADLQKSKLQDKLAKLNLLYKYSDGVSNQDLKAKVEILKFMLYYVDITMLNLNEEKQRTNFQQDILKIKSKLDQMKSNSSVKKLIEDWKTNQASLQKNKQKGDLKGNGKWESIKLKTCAKFAQYYNIHFKKREAIQCYKKLKYYQNQIYHIALSMTQNTISQKKVKYNQLMDIAQHFKENLRFQLALQCYFECLRLFRDQFNQFEKIKQVEKQIVLHRKNMLSCVNKPDISKSNLSDKSNIQYISPYKALIDSYQLRSQTQFTISEKDYDKELLQICNIVKQNKYMTDMNHQNQILGHKSAKINPDTACSKKSEQQYQSHNNKTPILPHKLSVESNDSVSSMNQGLMTPKGKSNQEKPKKILKFS